MIWPCRILLLFLICTTFFPRSRNEDPESTSTTTTTNVGDDEAEGEEKENEETTETSSTTTTDTSLDASDQLFQTEAGPEETYLIRDPENDYKICLALKFEAGFTIFYPDKDGKTLKDEPATPEDFEYEGTCNVEKDTHSVTLQWLGYNFTLVVTKNNDSWFVKSMELKFNPQKTLNAPDEPSLITLSAKKDSLDLFTAPLAQSLSCAPNKGIQLYTSAGTAAAAVVIRQLRLQAFDVGNEFKSDSPCAETVAKERKYQSDTAPIAVGSTLAILTLGVIVGYAIYRSLTNKKVDYGNIQG